MFGPTSAARPRLWRRWERGARRICRVRRCAAAFGGPAAAAAAAAAPAAAGGRAVDACRKRAPVALQQRLRLAPARLAGLQPRLQRHEPRVLPLQDGPQLGLHLCQLRRVLRLHRPHDARLLPPRGVHALTPRCRLVGARRLCAHGTTGRCCCRRLKLLGGRLLAGRVRLRLVELRAQPRLGRVRLSQAPLQRGRAPLPGKWACRAASHISSTRTGRASRSRQRWQAPSYPTASPKGDSQRPCLRRRAPRARVRRRAHCLDLAAGPALDVVKKRGALRLERARRGRLRGGALGLDAHHGP
jgi:hypothetical protein